MNQGASEGQPRGNDRQENDRPSDDYHQREILNRRRWLAKLSAAIMLSTAAKSLLAAKSILAAGPIIPRVGWTSGKACQCLPYAHYQHQARSPSTIVGSLPIQIINATSTEQRIREALSGGQMIEAAQHYQRKRLRPSRSQLRVDHCRVSDIVVDIDNRGYWWATFLAEQNFPLEPEQGRRFRQRIHLKRNEFEVKIRLLSSGKASSREISNSDILSREPDAGRLIVAKIEPSKFWVQRERPRHMQYSGHCSQIFYDFDLITAAEFEFSYRLDPLSDAGETVRRLDNP